MSAWKVQNCSYRVMWKFPGSGPRQANFECQNIKELLALLNTSRNVNETTVEQLYIHELLADGSVLEHLALEQSVNAFHKSTALVPIEDIDEQEAGERIIADVMGAINEARSTDYVVGGIFYKARPASLHPFEFEEEY